MPSIDRRALFSRHHVLALSVVVLAVTAGCMSLGESSADVTVENTESTTYQMSVYVFTEPVGAGNVTFQVTNSTGARKQLDSPNSTRRGRTITSPSARSGTLLNGESQYPQMR